MNTVSTAVRSIQVTLGTTVTAEVGAPGRNHRRCSTFTILVTAVAAAGSGAAAGVVDPGLQFTTAAIDVITDRGRVALTATEVVAGAAGAIGGAAVTARLKTGIIVSSVRTADPAAIVAVAGVGRTVAIITSQRTAAGPVTAGVGDMAAVGTGLAAADVGQDIINRLVLMGCMAAGRSVGAVTIVTTDRVGAAEVFGVFGGVRTGR